MSKVTPYEVWKEIIEDYYKTYGTIDVPVSCVYKGHKIGYWIVSQKKIYNAGKMSLETQKWLENMGMPWENRNERKSDISWNNNYTLLKEIYDNCGNANVPLRFTYKGQALGKWLQKQRERERKGILLENRKELLKDLHIKFEVQDSTCSRSTSLPEQIILYYMTKMFPDTLGRFNGYGIEFDVYSKKGNIAIEYDGQRWHTLENLHTDIRKNELCKEKNIRLYRVREIGCPFIEGCKVFTYNSKNAHNMKLFNECLKDLFSCIAKETNKKMIDIDCERDMAFIINGIITPIPFEWQKNYNLYLECIEYFGTSNIPTNTIWKGVNIGKWCSQQRQAYFGKRGLLNNEQKDLLEKVNFCWDIYDQNWDKRFIEFKSFYKKYKRMPKSSRIGKYNQENSLYDWIKYQQKRASGQVPNKPITKTQYDLLKPYGIFETT